MSNFTICWHTASIASEQSKTGVHLHDHVCTCTYVYHPIGKNMRGNTFVCSEMLTTQLAIAH